MKKFTLILLMLLVKVSFSQHVTYFDYDGYKLKNKNGAYYYSVDSSVSKNKIYCVKEYYISGNPKKITFYKDSRKKKKHGLCQVFDQKGILQSDYYFENNIKEGVSHSYYKNGDLYRISLYENDLLEGEQISYDDSARVQFKKIFIKNQLDSFTTFYKDGVIRRIEKHADGEMIYGQCYSHSGDTIAYREYYVGPKPVIGWDSLVTNVMNGFKSEDLDYVGDAGGTILINLVVLPDGSIDKVTVYFSTVPELEKKAIRIIKKFNNWNPALLEGDAIKQELIIPLVFQ